MSRGQRSVVWLILSVLLFLTGDISQLRIYQVRSTQEIPTKKVYASYDMPFGLALPCFYGIDLEDRGMSRQVE